MTFVQLLNDVVIAVFSCDQDPEVFPGVVEVEDDDVRLLAYLEGPPPDYLNEARKERDRLLAYATLKINPLQDDVDLDQADDDDVSMLKKWKAYRSAVGKTETKTGWPEAPQWPTPPVELEEPTYESNV